MELIELKTVIENGDIDSLKTTLDIDKVVINIKNSIGADVKLVNQYDPTLHDVQVKTIRKDKQIFKDTTKEGQEKILDHTVPVWRISLPIQKHIIDVAAGILSNPKPHSDPVNTTEIDMFQALKIILSETKFDYKFKEIFKRSQSEGESAILIYRTDAEPGEWDNTVLAGTKHNIKIRILSPQLGDDLYPIYDTSGNMICFARYYENETVDIASKKKTKSQNWEIYTAERNYILQKEEGSSWIDISVKGTSNSESIKRVENLVKKIPVIYFKSPIAWADVQSMIHRLEVKTSNHADTNDYVDSPITVAFGTVKGFADKGEQGKLLEATEGADVKYLTWDQAPESMKMEIENLQKYIAKYTHTPDFSFESVKGLGVVSGAALEMLFLDSHMKAKDNESIFGEGVQRFYNYIKQALSSYIPKLAPAVKLSINPVFKYFLPVDIAGEITYLNAAVTGKILSRQTAVMLNPLVNNAEEELQRIKKEELVTPDSGGEGDDLGKIPLALQQLSLAATRAEQNGDVKLADKLNEKMNDLLKTI